MSEAPLRTRWYFCHQCLDEINPRLPDYICPRCESGFIEELLEPISINNGPTSSSFTRNEIRFSLVDPTLFVLPQPYAQLFLGIMGERFNLRTGMPSEEGHNAENRQEMMSRQLNRARQPQEHQIQETRHNGVPTLDGISQQLVNGIIAPIDMPNMGMGPWGMLHSNPRDYAWGANGLDNIVTQLLNEVEYTGIPPADRENIKNLPTVQITEEHVGAGLDCPVCKQDYTEGESVRQLPCSHLFHSDCIVPWLEQHDTCPVCRNSLCSQNTAIDPPGLSC